MTRMVLRFMVYSNWMLARAACSRTALRITVSRVSSFAAASFLRAAARNSSRALWSEDLFLESVAAGWFSRGRRPPARSC